MKISELFPEVVAEDILYEFKSMLSQDNPSKWAKTIVGFANSEKGGTLFVGVSDNGEAFGLDFAEIDRENVFYVGRGCGLCRCVPVASAHITKACS